MGAGRIPTMRKLIASCQPDDKIICELGAGKNGIAAGIPCRKIISIDIDKSNEPP